MIVVNSFSKSWAMTGWRLGWITLPAELGLTFEMLTEYNIAGPAGFIQRAGVVAIEDGEPFVHEIVARYRAARDLVLERIGSLPRLSLAPPAAAFYAFMRVDGLTDSLAFAKDCWPRPGSASRPAQRSARAARAIFASASRRSCRPWSGRWTASRGFMATR